MLSKLRTRLTYANVMATIAVFVALGGSSYAAVRLSNNSVLSKHIKSGQVKRPDLARNAVDSSKVADGKLLASDFAAGQLPAGPQGPQGAQGPQGDKGDQGTPGATNVVMRFSSGSCGGISCGPPGLVVDSSGNDAPCLPGERATGGGGTISDSRFHLYKSEPQPVAQGQPGTAWRVAWRNASPDTIGSFSWTAYVICAAP